MPFVPLFSFDIFSVFSLSNYEERIEKVPNYDSSRTRLFRIKRGKEELFKKSSFFSEKGIPVSPTEIADEQCLSKCGHVQHTPENILCFKQGCALWQPYIAKYP